MRAKLVLDDIQKGGPLAKYDGLGARFAVGGFEDADERFGFAAASVDVEGKYVGGFAKRGGRLDEIVQFERFGAAHGAAMLGLDDAFDTLVSEHVGACGNHWVVELFEADWAVVSRIDAQLQHVL